MSYKVIPFTLGMLGNNVYVVQKENNCVVIDPTFDSENTVDKFIRNNGLHLEAVLLTHGHFDHCGGAGDFQKQGVPVFCNEADDSMCRSASANRWNIKCHDVVPGRHYIEGENIAGDFRFDVMFVPGHTKGGVCLIFDDLLFSGDTLFHGTVGRADLPGGDYSEMLRSLKRISLLPDNLIVYPGHSDYGMLLGDEKRANPYLNRL